MRGSSPLLSLLIVVACTTRASSDAPTAVDPEPASQPSVRAAFRGTIDLEAHLARPGDTVPLELGWAQQCIAETCRVEQTVGTGDDAQTVTIWSTPEATWIEAAPTRFSEEEAPTHRRLLALFDPEPGAPQQAIRYAHPRLGTTTDTASYGDYAPEGVPTRISVDFHDADVAWSGSLSLESVAVGETLEPPTPPPSAEYPEPSIAELDEGLWDVRIPAHDARSLVVEFPSFVVVLEAPWSATVGEEVVDMIQAQPPDKPIRYVLYSHHHPHYTGGLRAFMAAGASVVTATEQVDFVRDIAGLDFSLQPDRFAESGAEASVIAFDDTFTIAEDGRSLQVIDIGERSSHTAVYDVFWLPESKTLIQGDIGWFIAPDGAVQVGGRSAGLLEAIDAHALPVERLIQTWPVNSQEPTLDIEAFRAALK